MTKKGFIEFYSIRGKQGIYTQFATTWSLFTIYRLLGNIAKGVLDNPESNLDYRFIEKLARDLTNPACSFSVSPIVVSVSEKTEFIENEGYPDLGYLRIPTSARLEIMDGVHRVAALVSAKLHAYRMTKDDVPVLILPASDPERVEWLRKNFVKKKPEKRSILTDDSIKSRTIREMTKDVLVFSQFLSHAVAVGKSTMAPRSKQLLTHSGFIKACKPLFYILFKFGIKDAPVRAAEYWQYLSQVIIPWRNYQDDTLSASVVRNTTVLTSAAMMSALGRLGAQLFKENPNTWRENLANLTDLNWNRGFPSLWEERATRNGRLLKGPRAELRTLNLLKLTCGLNLLPDELLLETRQESI